MDTIFVYDNDRLFTYVTCLFFETYLTFDLRSCQVERIKNYNKRYTSARKKKQNENY